MGVGDAGACRCDLVLNGYPKEAGTVRIRKIGTQMSKKTIVAEFSIFPEVETIRYPVLYVKGRHGIDKKQMYR